VKSARQCAVFFQHGVDLELVLWI